MANRVEEDSELSQRFDHEGPSTAEPQLKLGISRAKTQRPRRKITLSFQPKEEIFLRSLAFARDDMPSASLGILGVLAREQGANQWRPATTRKVGERCSQSCCVGF